MLKIHIAVKCTELIGSFVNIRIYLVMYGIPLISIQVLQATKIVGLRAVMMDPIKLYHHGDHVMEVVALTTYLYLIS